MRIVECNMLSTPDIVKILSKLESPVQPTMIIEKFMSMPFGSSLIPKGKRKA